MGYLAIARKWRPSRFEDLIGQSHVVQTLTNAIVLNRVSHAYLFSGARGVGKTSVARIFAKALRCPSGKPGSPCNVCSDCVSIAESRSVDVVEIDGASNNGVESVRAIRENAIYGAASGFYKIYIIDEAHMLSLSAFNALLKTLEEPPAHVLFILATTEVQKIPLTILSRCQRFEFRRLTTHQIVERLQSILREEKTEMAEEGLHLIAQQSDGSLRDALSLLDQVISYFGAQPGLALSAEQVASSLGISETTTTYRYFTLILEKNTKALVSLIGEVYSAGIDLKNFSQRCLEELRLLYMIVLAKTSGETLSAKELDISAGQLESLKKIADQCSLVQIERMAQIFSKMIPQLGWSSLPRFVFEMASVRMTKLDLLDGIEESPVPVKRTLEPIAAPAIPPSPAPPKTEDSWRAFVATAMKKRPILGSLLSHANFKIESQEDRTKVILVFPSGFYEQQAHDRKNRQDIEEQLKNFYGANTELILSGEAPNTSLSLETRDQEEISAIKKMALEHPAVMQVKEVLGAEVVKVNVGGEHV